jgi:hypothetical protein
VAFVLVSEAWRLFALAIVFAALLVAARYRLLSGSTLRTLLAIVIIGQATLSADHYLNGRHTRHYSMPFEKYDPVMATHDEFQPPSPAQLRQLNMLLDNKQYRSLLICPNEVIPVDCSSAIGMTWRIRLVDGYLSGVPRRYASLPWPSSTVGLRSIRFTRLPALPPRGAAGPAPWRLLSLLNVRNALVVTRTFYTNDHFDLAKDLVVFHNPSPFIYQRAYFASQTKAVTRDQAIEAIALEFGQCHPRMRTTCPATLEAKLPIDYVEGPVLGDFDPRGTLTSSFNGDRVELRFPPSPRKRFLVVNEAYDKHWTADARGRTLDVYPTNVVMRGIVVPEGATRVALRYHSVVEATRTYLAVVLPLGAVLGFLVRKRLRDLIDRVLGPTAPDDSARRRR